jgi:hypothetical protein
MVKSIFEISFNNYGYITYKCLFKIKKIVIFKYTFVIQMFINIDEVLRKLNLVNFLISYILSNN